MKPVFSSFDVPRSTRLKLVRGDRQGLRGVLQEQLQAGGKNLRLPWRSLRPGDLLGDISGTSLYFIEIYGELYMEYMKIYGISRYIYLLGDISGKHTKSY